MSKQDEQRLLVKIATLYYVDGMKQSEIAGLLNLSQSFVSRSITRCQKEGVVKISVIQPANIFLSLEQAIEKQYGIRQAIVVDVDEPASGAQIKHAIGRAAAHYVETRLRVNDLVGISSWSSTIRAMVDELHPQSIKARGVIQLLGGVGPNGNVQATILTQNLAAQLDCPAWLLPSQSIEHSVEERAKLVASQDVAEVVGKFAEVDVAIVGIGDLEPSQLLKNSGNYYGEAMLQTLAERGAVGDICLHYFNAQGEPVLGKEEDPVIGMELSQVRECSHVVALAGGVDKTNAIRGALKGGYIDVLITDYPTARQLI
ncbi:TPA: sugar-binding transcriptional regulator [Serratia fonticola]|jgi:DNA-binding transcriptional regulator LsrR (DeoR family)|uniref:sugar-binding transcriptional regulator n=1 Tax=Serratia fonticola TaxID=47917 RepID=UPI000629E759|nr:sugar-binding transcriptional regulator [Serratia fonticola]AKG71585.1 DeoR faimly transcriptional regulator [Serratia fonticola]NTY86763.1 sugar-binding transcriptional regulator [Serratia fonticola]NTZ12515.1 sugar-binding transcriptional regulator [Serratia fonticola]CAI1741402.1 Sor operon activator [Serratia fonticola]HBE9182156.1 sugar-binding transcriptional regulator [Serratia fonticola]